MEHNREPKNRPMQIKSTDFLQKGKGTSMEKGQSTNAGTIEHPYAKE